MWALIRPSGIKSAIGTISSKFVRLESIFSSLFVVQHGNRKHEVRTWLSLLFRTLFG